VIISQIIRERLDSTTRKAWGLKLNDLPFPPLEDFITFLEGRRRALENLNPGKITAIRTQGQLMVKETSV